MRARRISGATRLTLSGALLIGSVTSCGFADVGTLVDPTADSGATQTGPAPPITGPRPAADPNGFCDPSEATLIACFEFDGAIVDGSAHAQTTQVTGAPSFVPGVSDRSVSLTLSTTIHVPQGPAWSFTSLTTEMWFRPSALPQGGGRAGLIDKDGSFGLFVQPNGDVACTMSGGVEANGAAVPGRWTHVACTHVSGRVTLYIDGREISSAKANALTAGTAVTAIGGNSPSGDPFVGEIDRLRVFARARTPAEITAAARR